MSPTLTRTIFLNDLRTPEIWKSFALSLSVHFVFVVSAFYSPELLSWAGSSIRAQRGQAATHFTVVTHAPRTPDAPLASRTSHSRSTPTAPAAQTQTPRAQTEIPMILGTSELGSGGSATHPYFSDLLNRIAAGKAYPPGARRLGLTGTVMVDFVLKRDGTLSEIKLGPETAHPWLNQAALETLERVGRVAPIPEEIALGDLSLRVPIRFTLTQNHARL